MQCMNSKVVSVSNVALVHVRMSLPIPIHCVGFCTNMSSLQGTPLAVEGVAVYNLSLLPMYVMHLI